MDLGPLRNLWPGGRHRDPSPGLLAALADLDRLIVDRPALATPGRSLSGLLRAAFHPPVPPPPTWSSPQVIHEAWGAGVPAFRAAPPPIEREALRSRGLALGTALRADNPRSSALHAAIRRREIDLRAWWDEVLAGRPESIDRQAEALSIDPALALSVLRLALLPDLAASSGILAPLLHEGAWGSGDCPHCGSPPVLAESRGLEGRRILRCGLCAAGWPGDRLRCTSCGETDHRALRSTYVEGEGDRFRLACCDRCGLALKVVSTLAPLSPPGLLVTELATVHLDMIAHEGEARDESPGG